MPSVNRESLIAAMKADDAERPIKVEIPRWGTLYVRVPSVEEVENRRTASEEAEGDDRKMQLARSAAFLICDEAGNRLFDADSPTDLALLRKRRWSDLERVLTAGRDQGN